MSTENVVAMVVMSIMIGLLMILVLAEVFPAPTPVTVVEDVPVKPPEKHRGIAQPQLPAAVAELAPVAALPSPIDWNGVLTQFVTMIVSVTTVFGILGKFVAEPIYDRKQAAFAKELHRELREEFVSSGVFRATEKRLDDQFGIVWATIRDIKENQ